MLGSRLLAPGLDVLAPFPGELVERHLGLRPVGKADDYRLLEHAERPHLACHAPAAPARGLARRVDARQVRAQLLVRRELVEQAALEPAAVAQEPRVRQGQVLRLRHPHRDRLEPPEVGRAAELAPARPDAVQDLGRVARADLPHLDPRAELAREVSTSTRSPTWASRSPPSL